MQNAPTGLTDPFGLQALGWRVPKSQTPFGTPRHPQRRRPYNCAAYGLGITDDWLQPTFAVGADWGLIPFMKFHGCYEVPCDRVEPCGKRHRVNTYQDPANTGTWHVERQDCTGLWASKNGQNWLFLGISDPDDFYRRAYHPIGKPKKTCWSCKGK